MRCKEATTAQGLDPVVEVLTAAGHKVVVEQTGGFTMVATVYGEDGEYVAITCEGDETGMVEDARPGAEYLVYVYDGSVDDEGTAITFDNGGLWLLQELPFAVGLAFTQIPDVPLEDGEVAYANGYWWNVDGDAFHTADDALASIGGGNVRSTCENPSTSGDACGTCEACKRDAAALRG